MAVFLPATIHELCMRSLLAGLFIGFAMYARYTINKLQVSEARFRNAFETSGIGMALVGLDGRWLKVNTALSSPGHAFCRGGQEHHQHD